MWRVKNRTLNGKRTIHTHTSLSLHSRYVLTTFSLRSHYVRMIYSYPQFLALLDHYWTSSHWARKEAALMRRENFEGLKQLGDRPHWSDVAKLIE